MPERNKMFVDEINQNDIASGLTGSTAGRVNFNPSAAGDYLTNENYKTLRTNLFFCGADIKVILLTSCRENEGKSTISTELARNLAEADKKTLFIDADMRKSLLQPRNLKQHNHMGLSEFLSGQAEIKDIIYNTQDPDFDVIFSGRFPPNPVELLGGKRFSALLSNMRNIYDYVIIDTPPLGTVIDAAVMAPACDGAIMVITPGKITSTEALEVKKQLDKSGCKILGAILNDIYGKRTKYYKKYYKKYENSTSGKKIRPR